jgi:hypothetical protein
MRADDSRRASVNRMPFLFSGVDSAGVDLPRNASTLAAAFRPTDEPSRVE